MDKKPANSEIRRGFSERLNQALQLRKKTTEYGWPNWRIGDRFEMSEASVSKLRTEKMLPSVETGIELAVWLKVSFEWLMTGRGDRDVVEETRLESLPDSAKEMAYDLVEQPHDLVERVVLNYRNLKSIYGLGQGKEVRAKSEIVDESGGDVVPLQPRKGKTTKNSKKPGKTPSDR